MLLTTLLPLALVAHGAVIKPDHVVRQAASGTATVNLASPLGTPGHLASGLLYGIPDQANQIPSSFYTGMGFNYGRAGGSQLPSPASGWVYGTAQFQARFASALSNYQTTRQYGARFQLILSDLWGADGTAQVAMPGDNGNWTSYDNFLQAVFANIKKYSMTPGLDLEIWNEPDLSGAYWQRNQTQYLQMWGHGYAKIRAAYPSVPINGPCTSSQPSTSNSWYQQFYPFVKSNNSVPDIYCWHEESGGDVQTNVANNAAALTQYGLPTKPIIVNEYATPSEQVPGTSVWYMSRFERTNTRGLRGNWASHYSLHDYFANLLGKPSATENCQSTSCATSTGYWGNGEYGVYRYYGTNMTGNRLQTTGSPDNLFDVYATAGSTFNSVKILAGSRGTQGSWNILVENLNTLGLPSSGTITIHTWHFTFAQGQFGNEPPSDQGNYNHTYTNNQLVFNVGPDTTTAYAFEFFAHY